MPLYNCMLISQVPLGVQTCEENQQLQVHFNITKRKSGDFLQPAAGKKTWKMRSAHQVLCLLVASNMVQGEAKRDLDISPL
ncbi:hypothetical protein TRIUR3_04988 [Triticum urartu]|uniref:Uncharacterized protein n=1 Tax=Triticum urartu TaxID=4572 RepID=M7YY04_TRIUA|nr:hypothetical protein TRIUR3_04988 [Triticum urartu]